MTEADVVALAGAKARELGFPWDPTRLTVRRWRPWPFSAVWQVVSHHGPPPSRTTIRVRESTRLVIPVGVRYLPLPPPSQGGWRLGPRLGVALVVAGGAGAVAHRGLGWSGWASALLALAWGALLLVLPPWRR